MMLMTLGLWIGPLQVKRRGDDADDVGPLPAPADWALQVKRSGDDASDVGPLVDWAPAGKAQGRGC